MNANNITLKASGVLFNREEHTYTLDGQRLEGITTMIRTQLFPDKYAAVPDAVLQRAADYGTGVHESIEMYFGTGINDGSQELQNYIGLIEGRGLHHVACEYIVTDGRHFASPIDHVLADEDGGIWLDDHKTTYAVDRDYLAWQLSWYAVYFEKQNPELKVKGLICSWLRHETAELIDIRRIDEDYIHTLETEYLQHLPSSLGAGPDLPAEVTTLADMIWQYEAYVKDVTKRRDALKEHMMEMMKANACEKVQLDGKVTISLVAPGTRESLDSSRLKKEHPDIYAAYLKRSTTRESLRILTK